MRRNREIAGIAVMTSGNDTITQTRHRPMRTCIGCGRKEEKRLLLRFTVAEDGVVTKDERQVHKGRGAYICKDAECLDLAMKRGGFPRTFRRKVDLSNLRG